MNGIRIELRLATFMEDLRDISPSCVECCDELRRDASNGTTMVVVIPGLAGDVKRTASVGDRGETPMLTAAVPDALGDPTALVSSGAGKLLFEDPANATKVGCGVLLLLPVKRLVRCTPLMGG